MDKEIALVCAMTENWVIGRKNELIWRIPEDMKFFRRTTIGSPVIMGRKTFESIGKPLPGRRNIVMTRDTGVQTKGVIYAESVDSALAAAEDAARISVIGGGEIFKAFLPLANTMYITWIEHTLDGDTFFPAWDEAEWELVWEEAGPYNASNPYAYRFRKYRRSS